MHGAKHQPKNKLNLFIRPRHRRWPNIWQIGEWRDGGVERLGRSRQAEECYVEESLHININISINAAVFKFKH